jgi:hypothetical protein
MSQHVDVNHLSSPEDKIALFRSLFRGRDDVYPRRFENRKTGKSGYSPACGKILKRALLLTAWRAPLSRPTVDIDLMGRTNNELDNIRLIVTKLCNMQTEDDGVQFEAHPVAVARDQRRRWL